jgi:hypothetical protein
MVGRCSSAASEEIITVSRSACGEGWTRWRPGDQTFQVRNTDSVTADVALIDPASGAIYGELEGLGAGKTARRPDGRWTPVVRLDREQREKTDGAVAELAERLAPVATVAEPRRTS